MGVSTRILNLLFGRPLATSEERAEHIGPLAGIPVFGLDALSSAAYGPEAALTLLIPLGLVGVKYIVPVSAAIVILLVIVYFSYRQTIEAYPQRRRVVHRGQPESGRGRGAAGRGGADDRLRSDRAVGISAGVGALISAVPSLQPHTLELCLDGAGDSDHREHARRARHRRGVHDSHLPVYGDAADCDRGGRMAGGACGGASASGDAAAGDAGRYRGGELWLLLKVFSSGCTAMTGVEAVSNGVMAFREPTRKNAKTTLTIIIALLAVLLRALRCCAAPTALPPPIPAARATRACSRC